MCISVTDESVITGPGVRPGPGPGPGPGPVDWDSGKVDKTMSKIESQFFFKKNNRDRVCMAYHAFSKYSRSVGPHHTVASMSMNGEM